MFRFPLSICYANAVEQAYRKLSVENHPDRATNEEQRVVMHEKMIEINKAFEILGDPEKKQLYDAYGEDGPQRQPAMQQANFEYVTLPIHIKRSI